MKEHHARRTFRFTLLLFLFQTILKIYACEWYKIWKVLVSLFHRSYRISTYREIVVLMAIDTEKRLELNREYYMGAWKFIHESLSSSF